MAGIYSKNIAWRLPKHYLSERCHSGFITSGVLIDPRQASRRKPQVFCSRTRAANYSDAGTQSRRRCTGDSGETEGGRTPSRKRRALQVFQNRLADQCFDRGKTTFSPRSDGGIRVHGNPRNASSRRTEQGVLNKWDATIKTSTRKRTTESRFRSIKWFTDHDCFDR
jgi:hypothetical protein